MFDSGDSGAAAVDAIMAATRQENAAGAARLAAIGELYAVRAPEDDTDKLCWVIDGFGGLVCEIAAALGVSSKRARAQLDRAITLRERLPQVAAIYAQGLIDAVMVAMIVSRTDLIIDDALAREVDQRLAARILRWGRLSKPKMEQRIDAVIGAVDPAGVHGPPAVSDSRYLDVRPLGPGRVQISGSLSAASGVTLDAVLDAIAGQVCRADPRSFDRRRADAVDVLVTGGRLRCECGQSDCPAASAAERAAPVVTARAMIQVITEPASVPGRAVGFLPGFGQIPPEQVAQLAALGGGAVVRQVAVPPETPESGYRPSAALAEFVRCRDLTCRFPGCERPAVRCDLDHTVPYPAGPTHASNLKSLCRVHHLVKTFHTGWKDQQFPDGTIVWTSPSGHVYVTRPEGAHWFPTLGTPTGVVSIGEQSPPAQGRGRCMPTRKVSRAQERRAEVLAKRQANQERLDEQRRRRERELAANYQPPPF